MQQLKRTILSTVIIVAFSTGSAAASERSKWVIGGKLSVGIESDSNVSVEAIDSDLAAGDSLVSLDANLDIENRLGESTELRLGVSHSQNRYDEFSEFDLVTNFASLEMAHDFGRFSSGLVGRAITAQLASEDFLTFNQASWYVNSLLSKRTFLYLDYTYSEKQFTDFSDRDAQINSLSADVYYFLDGAKRYWVVGYKYEDEDAVADPFDRAVQSVKLRYTHSVALFKRTIVARVKTRYQRREYDSITPIIGEIRDDDRFRVGLEFEIPLSKSWFAQLEYEYSDYQSNLPSADYTQDIYALKIGWKFDP